MGEWPRTPASGRDTRTKPRRQWGVPVCVWEGEQRVQRPRTKFTCRQPLMGLGDSASLFKQGQHDNTSQGLPARAPHPSPGVHGFY